MQGTLHIVIRLIFLCDKYYWGFKFECKSVKKEAMLAHELGTFTFYYQLKYL